MLSIQTITSPKSVGPTPKASSTSLACAGRWIPTNRCRVRTRILPEWKSHSERASGDLRTSSWDTPTALFRGRSFLFVILRYCRLLYPSFLYVSYRKFYIPHHKHSLKWKLSGAQYAVRASMDHNIQPPTRPYMLFRPFQCTTETVRGPVAILEPGMQRAPPQLKILDPLFRVGSSRPQRMHNGLALSLLDFLLVTAMILLTPNDEWTNVTRTNPSESVADSGHSSYNTLSSDPLGPLLHNTSEATPEIELWRSAIPTRVVEEDQSQCGESSDGSSSRATSRLSFRTDIQSTTQHSTYPSGQGVFPTRSDSSLSLPSHSRSFSQHGRRRTRELPMPPMPPFLGHNPPSATSIESPVTSLPHGQQSQNAPPPIPPLPTALSASLPPHDLRLSVLSPISVSSRSVAASPTSSIHSRSLPTPPTSKPPLGLLPLISPNSAVAATTMSPVSEPAPPLPRHPTLQRAHSHSRLRDSSPYPSSPHDHKPLVKGPPHYAANAHISPPLPISAHTSVLSDVMDPSLNIRTTNVPPRLCTRSATTPSADTSLTSGDPYDMPPAYSSLDIARSSLRLRTVNGDAGSE